MKIRKFVLAATALFAFAACVYYDASPALPASTDGAIHEPVIIGAGTQWALDGMLSLPEGASAENPVPAVVIVAGSGASNMDGLIPNTMYPVHPYLDIANHLAANGIAVIRHDKRTYTHGVEMVMQLGGALTAYEEAMADALLATEILRADPRIDSDKIFILGHSLGGALAPRIHNMGGDYAGLILLGGLASSLVDSTIRQVEDQFSAALAMVAPDDPMFELAQAQAAEMAMLIEMTRAVQAMAPTMTTEEAQMTVLPFLGLTAYYYMDMMNNSVSANAALITAPILVIQGGRDFQISLAYEFPYVYEIFAPMPNATVVVYDTLNHIFAQSQAFDHLSHATELMTTPMSVDSGLLNDIVSWILAR